MSWNNSCSPSLLLSEHGRTGKVFMITALGKETPLWLGGWWYWFDTDSCPSGWPTMEWTLRFCVWLMFAQCHRWKPQDHLLKHDVPPHRPKPAASGLRWPSATGPPEGGPWCWSHVCLVDCARWRVVSSLGLWSQAALPSHHTKTPVRHLCCKKRWGTCLG